MKRNKGGEPYNHPTFLSCFPENGFPVGEKESPNIQMWFHFIEDRDSWRPRQLEFPGQIPERKKSHKEKATEIGNIRKFHRFLFESLSVHIYNDSPTRPGKE